MELSVRKNNITDKLLFIVFLGFYLYYAKLSPVDYVIWNALGVLMMLKCNLINDLRRATNLFNMFFFMFCIAGLAIFNFIIFNEQLVEYFVTSFAIFQFVFFFSIYDDQKIKPKSDAASTNVFLKYSLLFSILIGLLSAFVFYLKIGFIPILRGGLSPEDRVAIQAGNGFYLQFIRFGIYTSTILFFLTKRKKTLFALFLILDLAMLGTGFRGEFVQFFFFFTLCYLVLNRINVSIIKISIAGILTLFLVVYLEYIRTDDDSDLLLFVFLNLGHSLSVAVYNFDFLLSRFDNFQWGLTYFHNFSMFLPGPDVDYTNWLTEQVEMDFKGGITPTIVGDFYVNFSDYLYVGICFFAIFIKSVDNKIIKNQNLVIHTVFWINFSLLLSRSVTGGFSNQSLQLFITSVFIIFIMVLKKLRYESHTSA